MLAFDREPEILRRLWQPDERLTRNQLSIRAHQGSKMTNIPVDPNAKLSSKQTAAALTEAGYKTADPTLATKRSRGGGPPFQLYGRKPLYTWSTALKWAEDRLSKPVHSTSELFSIKAKGQSAKSG